MEKRVNSGTFLTVVLLTAGLAGLAALGVWALRPGAAAGQAMRDEDFAARYASPLAPLSGPVPVYHLGHSLTGRDMPAILAGFAGHDWNSQLGWGASLNAHRKNEVAGLAEENTTAAWRPAYEAIDSGDYAVVVLTEMLSLDDAIRWHDAPAALAFWAARIRAARPDARIYLYETWHSLNDVGGDSTAWAARIDRDLTEQWEGRLLRPAMAMDPQNTIYLIPGGQVMAAVLRAAEAGDLPGITGITDLLSDDIHFSDTGAWTMALTHFAVIYARSPVGLPARVARADGSQFEIDPVAARRIQEIVWEVVSTYPPGGVAGETGGAGQ